MSDHDLAHAAAWANHPNYPHDDERPRHTPPRQPDNHAYEPALRDALLELDATHARVDELSDRVTELERENHQLRTQLTQATGTADRPDREPV